VNLDKIIIRDLSARCIVGVADWERTTRQSVMLNITLECDLARAGQSDRLHDTIDYKSLKDEVLRVVEQSQFRLIEALAENVATLCLRDVRIQAATVSVDKPGALSGARSVAVEIRRDRRDVMGQLRGGDHLKAGLRTPEDPRRTRT
jgi:FolB domain-containing protein